MRDVAGCTAIPDADAVVVETVDLNVLREGFVLPGCAPVFFFVPYFCDEDADDGGGKAEESQAHLPGGAEDAFEGCVHDGFQIRLPI